MESLIEERKNEIVDYLEPTRRNNILTLFISYNKKKLIEILFAKLNTEQRNKLLSLKNSIDHTAIHSAVSTNRDDLDLVKQLIILDESYSLLESDKFGNIALYNAAVAGNMKVFSFLLDLGLPLSSSIKNCFTPKQLMDITFRERLQNHQALSNEQIVVNIKSLKLSQQSTESLKNNPTLTNSFEMKKYLERILFISPQLIRENLPFISTFLDKLYGLCIQDPTLIEELELKRIIPNIFKLLVNSRVLPSGDNEDKKTVLIFLRFIEMLPDIVPITEQSNLIYYIKELELYNDPVAICFLKRIENKNIHVKYMLFFTTVQKKAVNIILR
ncbi:MAG: ankyrin repeat domain-containing protein [Legionella sp.]